ncbi:MAG TPA: type II toxin-antitoxin system VapC family toxin [Xanthobacteraceae bacterium]|jgi:predicted nucleic acid-binding protein
MTIIVDASVAVRWFIDVPGSDKAYRLIEGEDRILAPDLVIAEIASALWKAVRFAGLAPATAAEAIAGAGAGFHELISARTLADRALAIALDLRHPIYDCFYLALAQARTVRLVTADDRLMRVCAHTPFAKLVRSL